jgi:SulP family sulfate permease
MVRESIAGRYVGARVRRVEDSRLLTGEGRFVDDVSVAGMLHAVFLLVFILAAAPLASYVPLAALAGVLVVVAWNMAEKEEFVRLLANWRSALVLLATFGLTLARDLTAGIVAGCALAALFWAMDRARAGAA